jgi:hypothetical protein
LARQLLALGTPLEPLSRDLAATAQSFDNAGGIEDVMRFIYYYAGAVNGENALGHYIRSLVEIGQCSPRSSSYVNGCGATFGIPSAGAAQDAKTASSQVLRSKASARWAGTAKTLLNYLLGP